jgi:hypothetical protein
VSHIIVVTTCSPRVEVGAVGKNVPELGHRSEEYSWSPRAWSVVILQVGLIVGEVCAEALSHPDDGAAEQCW